MSAAAGPPGLELRPNAIPIESADALEHWLGSSNSEIPWERAVEGRRVAQYGCRYDYVSQGVDLTPCAPIPDMLRAWLIPDRHEFTQCIINEYGPDDAIPYHTDDSLFGPNILVFILGETRPLLLRREWPLPAGDENLVSKTSQDSVADPSPLQTRFSVDVGHRGSYEMSGETRYDWQHAIPLGRKRRVSITFRSMVRGAHVIQQHALALQAELTQCRKDNVVLQTEIQNRAAQLRGCEEANDALMMRVQRLERGEKAGRAKERSWARERQELQRENNNLARQLKVLEAEVLNFMQTKGFLENTSVAKHSKRGSGGGYSGRYSGSRGRSSSEGDSISDSNSDSLPAQETNEVFTQKTWKGHKKKKKKKKQKKQKTKSKTKKKKKKKSEKRGKGETRLDAFARVRGEGPTGMGVDGNPDNNVCMICQAVHGKCVHTKRAALGQQAWSSETPANYAGTTTGIVSGLMGAEISQSSDADSASSEDSDYPAFNTEDQVRNSGGITARTRQLIASLGPRRRGGTAGSLGTPRAAVPEHAEKVESFSDSEAEEVAMRGGKVSHSPTQENASEVSSLTQAVAWTGMAVSKSIGLAASLVSGFVTSRGDGADIVDSTSSEEESGEDSDEDSQFSGEDAGQHAQSANAEEDADYPSSEALIRAAERRRRYLSMRPAVNAGAKNNETKTSRADKTNKPKASTSPQAGDVSWSTVREAAVKRVARVTRGGGVPVERSAGVSDPSAAVQRAARMSAVHSGRRSHPNGNKNKMKTMAPAVLGISENMKKSLTSLQPKKERNRARLKVRRGAGVRKDDLEGNP